MTTDEIQDTCATCIFSKATMQGMTCNRFPPVPFAIPMQNMANQIVPQMIMMRPLVQPGDFCGEYDEGESNVVGIGGPIQ